MEIYYQFKCLDSRHQQNAPATRVCLGHNCLIRRMICNECLSLHIDHLQYCVTFDFLLEILQSERKKINSCKNLDLPQTILDEISVLQKQLNNAITQLQTQHFDEIKQIILLSSECVNGLIEQKIYYFIYNSGHQNQQNYIEMIQNQYSTDDEYYLINLFLQQGDIYFLTQNLYMAMSKYQQAHQINEILNSLYLNETIREKLLLLNIALGRVNEASSICLELWNNYRTDQNQKTMDKQFIYSRLEDIQSTPEIQPIYLCLWDTFCEQHQFSTKDFEEHHIQGNQLLLYKEYTSAVKFYENLIEQNPAEISFVFGKLNGLIGCQEFLFALQFIEIKLQDFPGNNLLKKWKHYLKMITDHTYLVQQKLEDDLLGLFIKCLSFVTKKQFQQAFDVAQVLENSFKLTKATYILKGLLLIQMNQKEQGFLLLNKIQHDNRPYLKSLIFRLTEQYQDALNLIDFNLQCQFYEERMWIEKYSNLYEKGNVEDLLLIEQFCSQQEDFLKEIQVKKQSKNYTKNKVIFSKEYRQDMIEQSRIILIRCISFMFQQALSLFKLSQKQSLKESVIYLEQALKYVNQLLQKFSGNNELLFLKGKIFYNLNKYDEAQSLFEQCSLNAQEARYSFCKGVVLYKKGYYQKAVQFFNEALNLDQTYWSAIYNKGIALIQQKQIQFYEESEQCFTKTIKHQPRSNVLIAYCQLLQGKCGNAIALLKYYLTSVDWQQNYEDSQQQFQNSQGNERDQNFGNIIKQEIESILLLNQGINNIPNNSFSWSETVAWISKAKYYHQSNELEKALECYNQCLFIDEESTPALYGKLQILKCRNIPEEMNEIISLTQQLNIQVNDLEQLENFEGINCFIKAIMFQYCLKKMPSLNHLETSELTTVNDKIDILHCLTDLNGFIAYFQLILYDF